MNSATRPSPRSVRSRLAVDEHGRDRLLERARQADADVGVLRLARAVDHAAHDRDAQLLGAGVGRPSTPASGPSGRPGSAGPSPGRRSRSCGRSPGHAETCGRNERRPIDWRTCWATSTSRSRGAPGSGVSDTRIVSPMPSLSRIARPAVEAMIPLSPMPGLGQPEVERVVAAGGEQAIDVDEVAHAADLGADDDLVVTEAGLLGQLGRAQRRLEHRLDHHVARVARFRETGVLVHELGQHGLVERAPVDPDPDRLVVVDRHLDDRREVLVMALRADVARVDPVLRQEPRPSPGTRPAACGRCNGSRR